MTSNGKLHQLASSSDQKTSQPHICERERGSSSFYKTYNFLVPKCKFCYLEIAYALLLSCKGVKNVNMSIHDTLITLIHV